MRVTKQILYFITPKIFIIFLCLSTFEEIPGLSRAVWAQIIQIDLLWSFSTYIHISFPRKPYYAIKEILDFVETFFEWYFIGIFEEQNSVSIHKEMEI